LIPPATKASKEAEDPMRSWFYTFSMLLSMALAPLAATAADDAPKENPQPAPNAQGAPSEVDEPVEPFVPARPRSSLEEDRVESLARFTAARMAEQKQDYARALRWYERAWRLNPDATLALREIVPLAFNLERQSEAVRYALILAEREPGDPQMLRRLALYLTEEGEAERALRLYEAALKLEPADKSAANAALVRMEMGRLCFLSKKYVDAARHFGEIVKMLDDEHSGLDATARKTLLAKPDITYQLFGESFLEANRPDDAMAAFEKSQKAKANDAMYAFNLARVAALKNEHAQALDKLQAYFDKRSTSQGIAPYQLLAEQLGKLGQENQLIPRLEKLHESDGDNMPLAHFLGQQYRSAGQTDKAEAIYVALFEAHKSRPPIEAFQGLLDIYQKQQNAEKVLTTLGEAVGRVGSLTQLGASGKTLVADTELSKRVVALATADPAKLTFGQALGAALLAMELKDYPAANTCFDRAIAADPKKAPEALISWGLELFAAEQFAEAIKVFRRGLDDKALGEKNSRLHFYLAGALEMDGQTDAAIAEARKAAALENDAPRFASRVAWIQYHAKRYADARASYSALIEVHDKTYDSPEVRDVMRDARLALSNLAVMQNNLAEAEEWVEQVLDEYPEDASAMNDLGYLWTDGGKHLERSLAMVKVAVAQEPKNMAYRDSLGWALYRLGRYNEALAELKAAAAVDDPDGVILDHLGDALHKTSDDAGAIDNWTKAALFFDKRSEPDKAKQARDKIEQLKKKD
jgi:tetratricopeptide (TPR) repeat protein